MSTVLNQRSPVAKAGWLIGLFLAGWLAFLFLPWPWRAPPPEPLPRMVVGPPSKLQMVGLKDNPDWEGLPEFFAIWADHAEWKINRTRFAYWHPVMKDYSYHFEAVRVDGGYRFEEIPEPIFPTNYWPWDDSLGEECPIRFYRTPPAWPHGGDIKAKFIEKTERGDSAKVKVDIAAPMIPVPETKPTPATPPPKS